MRWEMRLHRFVPAFVGSPLGDLCSAVSLGPIAGCAPACILKCCPLLRCRCQGLGIPPWRRREAVLSRWEARLCATALPLEGVLAQGPGPGAPAAEQAAPGPALAHGRRAEAGASVATGCPAAAQLLRRQGSPRLTAVEPLRVLLGWRVAQHTPKATGLTALGDLATVTDNSQPREQQQTECCDARGQGGVATVRVSTPLLPPQLPQPSPQAPTSKAQLSHVKVHAYSGCADTASAQLAASSAALSPQLTLRPPARRACARGPSAAVEAAAGAETNDGARGHTSHRGYGRHGRPHAPCRNTTVPRAVCGGRPRQKHLLVAPCTQALLLRSAHAG